MPLALPDRTRDVLSWLAYCFCGYAAFLLAWTVWKGRRPKHAARWMKFVADLRKARNKVDGWASSLAASWMFAIACVSVLVFVSWRARSNVVTEHNVIVCRRLDDGDWQMTSDEETDLVFRPCPSDAYNGVDVDGLLRSAVGYVADYARWEERGTCKSILRADLGFWFRDKHNNFAFRRIQ